MNENKVTYYQKKLADRIANTTDFIIVRNTVISLAEKMKGQQLNRRFLTALKKELPNYYISYEKGLTYVSLTIWGNGVYYDKRHIIYLADTGYLSGKPEFEIDPETIKSHNPSGILETDRLIKYKAAKHKIAGWLKRKDKIALAEQKLQDDMQVYDLTFLFNK